MNQRFLIATVLAIAVMLGCNGKPPPKDLPKVYKATGKVVNKKTSQPLADGAVQFEALASQGQVAIAEIQPDGTFSLNTFVDGTKLEGAVLGPQRVTFMPRATEDQASAVPVTLPETFEVKETGNDFTIQVDAQSP